MFRKFFPARSLAVLAHDRAASGSLTPPRRYRRAVGALPPGGVTIPLSFATLVLVSLVLVSLATRRRAAPV